MSRKRRKKKAHHLASRESEDAWAAVDAGDLDLAVKIMSRAGARAGASPDVSTDWGRILARCGRLKEAERALRFVIATTPSYADAYVELAAVLSGMGLSIRAWEEMQRAVELQPEVQLYRELLATYASRLPEDERGRR